MDNRLVMASVLLVVFGGLALFTTPQTTEPQIERGEMTQVSSAEDLREYLETASSGTGGFGSRTALMGTTTTTAEFDSVEQAGAPTTGGDGGAADDARHSGTNVQVEGIDEPDIVKTDGETIYYSRSAYWDRGNVSFIDARPAENASVIGGLKVYGELLRDNDSLIVLPQQHRGDTIRAFDVSSLQEPVQQWSARLNGSITAARFYDGSIYLVVQDRIEHDTPCPVRPMVIGGDAVTVPCTSIWRPSQPAGSDVTYTVMKMDPSSGDLEDTVSFVGTYSDTVYMSENGIYVANTHQTSYSEIYLRFFRTEGVDLLSSRLQDRFEEVDGYNISDEAKLVEAQQIVDSYRRALDPDARKTFDTRWNNAFGNYTADRKREFQQTTVTRLDIIDGLSVASSGQVPGHPLNQFSMDEHEGNLRVATTVDPWMGGSSENDVYVLDGSMDITGRVTGMGVTERIYSVRFIDDKGYVVTFRRIDPFHVLDLSDPQNPTLEGELKLPGYSSYLHPIAQDRILGIGEEDGQVKAVMFDVADPTNPTIEDEYLLDETWSSIAQSHHAFLQDPRHEVFFIPAGNGGYVFSYSDGIELETAVDLKRVQRAVYIDDYLYVIGQDKIAVLDETTWDRVHTIDLPSQDQHRPKPEPVPEPRLR